MAYSKWLKKTRRATSLHSKQPKKSSRPTLWILDLSCETIGISAALKATPRKSREMCPMFCEIQSFHAKKSRGKILHLLCLVCKEDWLWYKLYMMAGWWWCSGLDFLVLWGLTHANGVTSPSIDFQTYLNLASRRPPKFKPNPRTELGLQYQRQIWSQAAYEKGGMIAARINIRN